MVIKNMKNKLHKQKIKIRDMGMDLKFGSISA